MVKLQNLLNKLSDKLMTWSEALIGMLPNLLVAGCMVLAASFVSRYVARVVFQVTHRVSRNEPISDLLGAVARLATIAIGLFFALGLLKLDKTVTSLLAGVGIVGLALGFAFQDIAANFMSGFIMAINQPFVVGDLVEVSGHRGYVKKIAMRASLIETLQGLSILVPNKDIFQNAIVNYTNTPHRRMDLTMGTAYGDDMQTVRSTVVGAVQDIPHRDPDREIDLLFSEFGDSSINFTLRIWLNQADEPSYDHARSEAMIAIKRALDSAGLTIPFPIRTLDFGADAVGGKRLDQMRLHIAQDREAASR